MLEDELFVKLLTLCRMLRKTGMDFGDDIKGYLMIFRSGWWASAQATLKLLEKTHPKIF